MNNYGLRGCYIAFTIIFIFIFIGCSSAPNEQKDTNVEETKEIAKDPLEFNKVYTFWDDNASDVNIHFGCDECDPGWHIEFKDEKNATLYAEPTHKSNLRSCVSDVTYTYNSSTRVITFLSISNNNVNNSCKSNFLGNWVWNEEKDRFYSQNHPGANFKNW